MTTEKKIDRKAFLASTVAACAAVTLGACSDEGDGGGTGGTSTGGTNTGGTGVGGASTGGTAMGGAGTSGSSSGGSAGSSAGAGGSATGGAGSSAGGSSGAGTGGSAGGGTGGAGGTGGGTLTCTTETDNGTHSHPLTVPTSDVERMYQDAPYVLEDGGTGHTHTVELTAYEYLYLLGGTPVTKMSSTDANHSHPCVITCVES